MEGQLLLIAIRLRHVVDSFRALNPRKFLGLNVIAS